MCMCAAVGGNGFCFSLQILSKQLKQEEPIKSRNDTALVAQVSF